MEVLVKTSNSITTVSIEAKLLDKRKIWIEGEITEKLACNFIKQLLFLLAEDEKESIDILINSPGGNVNAGMLIYDALQSCTAPVRLFCVGMAYSMAAVIFASGTTRYMLPNSKLMIHEPLIESGVGGNSSSIKSISDSLQESKEKLVSLLVKHTKRKKQEVEEAIRFDHYFNAEESISFGMCDEIVGFNKIM